MEGGERAAKTGLSSQSSQSLFQVLYLGRTTVDRHCSPAVMQWIIEELKLRTEQRILTWLSPGEEREGGRWEGGRRGEGGEGREGVCLSVFAYIHVSVCACRGTVGETWQGER